jgi:predicted nucleic acid-binding protein
MNYLVDTCGWIEWVINGKYATQYNRYLKDVKKVLVPTIVQFELYKWICREKDEATALEVMSVMEQTKIISLDTSLALFAATISSQHKLAMADAIIYATSLQHNATLFTSDKHFQHLADVILITSNQSH